MKLRLVCAIIAASAALFLGGCYANKMVDKAPTKRETSRRVTAPFDSTWKAVMKVMAIYPLTIIEKESGILNTDWTNRTIYRKVSVWRGLIYGGQVDDDLPMELQERFNVLVSPVDDSTTTVTVIRYVKSRPYTMLAGPKGSWTPSSSQSFNQTESSTIPESVLLDAIQYCLSTGIVKVEDPEEVYRREQELQGR